MDTMDLKEPGKAENLDHSPLEANYPPEIAALFEKFDEPRRKKLLRKMDYHLIPIITLLYLFAYLDR